jgi:hypothetical protein
MPMKTRYAADTTVAPEKSRAQIELLLRAHGATEYATGWDPTHDRIQFRLHNLIVRFVLPRPDRQAYLRDRHGWSRVPKAVDRAVDQADRQRWRALYLVVRAKLEAVEANIATLEQEFLAYVVMPNGLTIGDALVPQLTAGKVPQLLGAGEEP